MADSNERDTIMNGLVALAAMVQQQQQKVKLDAIRAQYTDPRDPKLAIADEAILRAFHERIRTYTTFQPIATMDEDGRIGSLQKEYKGKDVPISEIEFREFCKTPAARQTTYVIGQPIPFDKIGSESHVYSFADMDDKKLDELDRVFVKGPQHHGFDSLEFLGVHTGAYCFFKPDLWEVIHLLHTKIKPDQLPNIQRLYVTTEPHPSEKGSECYDRGLDRHRAKTVCFVVWKPER
jgi:hypothetical protein